MLQPPYVQNELTDIYSQPYRKFLKSNIYLPLCCEPYLYIYKHIGFMTKAERFITEFLIGLKEKHGGYSEQELTILPEDVALTFRLWRMAYLKGVKHVYRVARADKCFKAKRCDLYALDTLRILPPVTSPPPTSLDQYSQNQLVMSLLLPLPREGQRPSFIFRHRSRMSLPILSNFMNPPGAVSQTLEPVAHSLL